MQYTRITKRVSTAYHEAGHAVCAHVLGATVECVSLDGEFASFTWPDADSQTEQRLLSYLAGTVCDSLVRGHRPWIGDWVRSGMCDMDAVNALVRETGYAYDERVMVRKTCDLMKMHWDLVERVVAELLERGELYEICQAHAVHV